ncbi:MAG: hypothetical protein H6955_21890 [Chromatiaceae bacterium]|nr:hypothetical protein [Chromatiaceae bacterium]
MSAQNTLKFPSGRSVKRLKQDARALSKAENIPLHAALDVVAQQNGMSSGWANALRQLKPQRARPMLTSRSPLAAELGISDLELEQLSWEAEAIENNDGLVYGYLITIEDGPEEVLQKVSGLDVSNSVRVGPNAFDEEEPEPEIMASYSVATPKMNPYRKLLVLGLNELLRRRLLSLSWDGKSTEETAHIEMEIAGHNAVVSWSDAGFGEVRISVWWKYDHSRHPQADLSGNARERFMTASPLAKRAQYPKFVGVVCSAWLERDAGKYLQGHGNDHLFEMYTRRGELDLLRRLADPVPLGYEPEGRFHM